MIKVAKSLRSIGFSILIPMVSMMVPILWTSTVPSLDAFLGFSGQSP
jgi:hypothetical protein